MEAYAHARVDRPDANLERRARLAGELQTVSALLVATGSGDQTAVDRVAAALRELDERKRGDKDDPLSSLASGPVRSAAVPITDPPETSPPATSPPEPSPPEGVASEVGRADASASASAASDASDATAGRSGSEPTVALPMPADDRAPLAESPGHDTRALPPPG